MAEPLYLTLSDMANRTHKGELIAMVDEMGKSTTLFPTMQWKQSTDMMVDVSGVNADIDSITAEWVGLDKGAKSSKSSYTQRMEHIAMIESWSEYNEKTQMVAPDADGARWEQDQLHIKKLGLTVEEALLYGNPDKNTKQPMGFFTRMNTLTDFEGKKNNVKQDYICLDGGGTTAGAQNSILLVASGAFAPTLLYPRYQADNGLIYDHFGYENTKDENGGNIRVAKSRFMMSVGLSIRHRRTAVRIANVDIHDDNSFKNMLNVLYEAMAVFPTEYLNSVKIWTNKKVILTLRQYFNKFIDQHPNFESQLQNTRRALYLDGMEINQCDSFLIDGEAVVQ